MLCPAPAASTGRTPAFTSSGTVIGRFWIEGLRTDSLYLFHWTLFGQRIRVSQALSLVMVLVCAGILVYQFKVKKADGSNLFVKRVQQTTEAEEAAAEPTAPDEKQ